MPNINAAKPKAFVAVPTSPVLGLLVSPVFFITLFVGLLLCDVLLPLLLLDGVLLDDESLMFEELLFDE